MQRSLAHLGLNVADPSRSEVGDRTAASNDDHSTPKIGAAALIRSKGGLARTDGRREGARADEGFGVNDKLGPPSSSSSRRPLCRSPQ